MNNGDIFEIICKGCLDLNTSSIPHFTIKYSKMPMLSETGMFR